MMSFNKAKSSTLLCTDKFLSFSPPLSQLYQTLTKIKSRKNHPWKYCNRRKIWNLQQTSCP